MFGKRKLRFFAVALVLCLLLPAAPLALAAPSELDGHWAKEAVVRWNSRGIIKGYPDGSLKPDGLITRAEFAALINRTFGFAASKPVEFADVHSGDWYEQDIEKAYSAGYMLGYTDGTVQPGGNITRQEASLILARLQKLSQDAEDYPFADVSSIPSWSKWAVMACAGKGLMVGYPDGSFQPEAGITRAETVTTLDRMFAEIYSEPGVYGSEVMTDIEGGVVVTATGITLQNVTIEGDLLIAQAVGDGEVTLKNVVVEGRTQVSGGGAHSVIVIDSALGTVDIDKENVTLLAQGKTQIDVVHLNASARVEEQDIEGDGIKDVVVDEDLPEGTTVVLVGNFNRVEVNSGSITLELEDGRIVELETGPEAHEVAFVLQEGSSVGILILNALGDVSGAGAIEEARINTSGSTIEQKPTKVTLGEDVTATVGGVVVGQQPTTGGGDYTPPPTTRIPVAYYTGKNFNRSYSPIVGSGDVVQTINTDGSIAITVKGDGYVDAGFVMEAGKLGELGSITVEGTGDYGLNLYFDLDGAGFFKWDGNTFDSVGGDAYALYLGSVEGGVLTITDSTKFNLMGTGGGIHTVSELKAKYGVDTPVGIWVGVTSPDGEGKTATIILATIGSGPQEN